jgi:hypothetical protein
MTDNPNLIECTSCAKSIAKTAQSCPHCGARNDWVDPRIAKICRAISSNEIGAQGEFTFYSNPTKVWGIATPSTDVGWGWGMKLSSGIMLLSLPMLYLLPRVGYLLLALGLLIMIVGALWQGVTGFKVPQPKQFQVVCTESGLEWQSNDDTFYQEIKAFSESM